MSLRKDLPGDPTEAARADAVDGKLFEIEQAQRRLQHLYDIGKELTRFQTMEHMVPNVVNMLARTLPLRSAIFIRETAGAPCRMIWQGPGADTASLDAAKANAEAAYRYFVSSGVNLEGSDVSILDLPARPGPGVQHPAGRDARGSGTFLVLPLVVDRNPIFGALQVESAGPLGEVDLGFVNAVVNQLSIAADRQAAQEALQQSEERYRALFGSTPMAVFVCDEDGVIQNFNRRAAELWGREPVCGLDRHCGSLRLFLPNGSPLPHAESPLVDVLRTGLPASDVEVSIERPDGSRLDVIVNFAALKDAHGGVTGVITSFVDITARKQAERASQDAAERFRFLAESLPQKIFTTTAEGEVDYLNARWAQFTGLPRSELNGLDWTAFISPADMEVTTALWRRSLETGDPFEVEHRFRRADGQYRWHLTRAHSMRGDGNEVSVWIGSTTDIDEQKRVETEQRILAKVSALFGNSLNYRETVAAVVDVTVPLLADICLVDEVEEDGQVRRHEVRFADEQLQGALADRARKYSPRAGWRTPAARVIETGQALLFEHSSDLVGDGIAHDEEHAEILRAAGVRSLMTVPLCARGKTLGALTLAAGLSGRRYSDRDLALASEIGRRAAIAVDNSRLYEFAQRATRSRDDLLAVVSHDLKNPLAVITINLTLLLRAAEGPQRWKLRKQLLGIQRSADRMARLVEDLLDTASIESGRLSVEPRRLALGPFVSEFVESLRDVAAAKSLHLVSEVAADAPAVHADGLRLQQVLANLVGNAIKFTPAGGSVTIRAEPTGDTVVLSVTDTGPGIAAANIPRLFDRFWQDRGTARLGTGLGLFIVKGIVEAHGGRIWVESRVGEGSTFYFTLSVHGGAQASAYDEEVARSVARERTLAFFPHMLQPESATQQATEVDVLVREMESRKRELHTATESARVAREFAERAGGFRRDLMSVVSHELRGPLTVLELLIERLRRDSVSPPSARQEPIIRRMFATVDRLTGIIESLLQHTLVQSGRMTIQTDLFDAREVTASAIEELRANANEKDITLRLVVEEGLPLLRSDPVLVRLILVNLIGNAIKFTERGVVEIRLDCVGGAHRFAVKDSGPGIPAQDRVRIFEPFIHMGEAKRKHVPGMGLGLTLVREVALALGGHVGLESDVGQGSTFTVTLPPMSIEHPEESVPLH